MVNSKEGGKSDAADKASQAKTAATATTDNDTSNVASSSPPTSPIERAHTFKLPAPERPRTFRKPTDHDHEHRDEHRDEVDPSLPSLRRPARRRSTYGRSMTRTMTSGGASMRRSRSRSATISSFPDLYIVDTAFSEAQREMTRVYSRAITPSGEIVPIAPPPEDPNKVVWAENDPENPQNWSPRRRWILTGLCALLTVNVTFASSAPSSATLAIAERFHTSSEVAVLTTSLFLSGYCLGPILWAPISELVGRRHVFVVTMIIYTLFQLPSALATNIESVLVGRFFAGTFAAAPLTNCGGVIADVWDPISRGTAMSIFSASVFIGPVIGPIIGGFTTSSFLGWRWVFWFMMIFSGACWVLVLAFLPETFAPVLLARRAKKLRKENPEKNKDLYADLERADFSLKGIITRTFGRPFVMLFSEPILLFVTLYLSIVYGLLYALFSVFPIVWGQLRGFNNGETGLMFIGVGIGTTIGALVNIRVQSHYRVLVPKWHGHPPPEERLYGAMLAGPFLIIGCFMLGWTGHYPSVHWMVPEIAALILGMSFTLVFISFLSYVIDTFLMFSASALAANTIVRSAVGAAFPLFTVQMFKKLGVNWACSLIGFIAILISPSPYVFYLYGSRIRDGSRFAPCLDIHMKERVEEEERQEREKMIANGEKVKERHHFLGGGGKHGDEKKKVHASHV